MSADLSVTLCAMAGSAVSANAAARVSAVMDFMIASPLA
jgi:hypothetical protein